MKLQEVNTVDELLKLVRSLKSNGLRIGFVPTMGFLHQGHMSLVQAAQQECDIVIASIYVNPTQFNDPKDFNNYPKDIERDKSLLDLNSCDYVFIPSQHEIESLPIENVDLEGLDEVMEGRFRPGHFRGVVEVVYRLFTACEPDVAFFGEKDFQQLMVIQKMVDALSLPIKIVGVPIVRELNGLAMSSRNVRLSTEGRAKAKVIFETLKGYPAVQRAEAKQKLSDAGFELEYFEVHRFRDSQRLFIAGFLEGVRLIDNIELVD